MTVHCNLLNKVEDKPPAEVTKSVELVLSLVVAVTGDFWLKMQSTVLENGSVLFSLILS